MLKNPGMITAVLLILFHSSTLFAEEDKEQGMPPAIVAVSEVTSGYVIPEIAFVGTVYYQEVSKTAAEVNGLVEEVKFEEGESVKKGQVLVKLSSELLERSLQSQRAGYEQVVFDLEKAGLDLDRAEKLFEEGLVSEELYDDKRFSVSGLEKRVLSLDAEVKRLEAELDKKTIRAPFDGIVLEKNANRGEWLSPGSSVATIANVGTVDVLVEVPLNVARTLSRGMDVTVRAGGSEIKGKLFTVIPRGNRETRTFPVKIRVKNSLQLLEGMEAVVSLPAAEKKPSLTVHRDAVITVFGNTVVYSVKDMKAEMLPVQVNGYNGMMAGISARGLEEGMIVVIKGNERLRPGQPVIIKK